MYCCGKKDFKLIKEKFSNEAMEMSVLIHKCLHCGREYIDDSVPKEVKNFIKSSNLKEKRNQIKDFFTNNVLTCSLREVRTRKNLTQPEVAARIGVSSQRISEIENNGLNIKIETGFRIAKALECNINDIWSYENINRLNSDIVVHRQSKIKKEK